MDRRFIIIASVCALLALGVFLKGRGVHERHATQQLSPAQQWAYWRDRGYFGNDKYCAEIKDVIAQIRSPQGLQLPPPDSWATTDFLRKAEPGKYFNLQGTYFLRDDPNTSPRCGVFGKDRSGYPGLYCTQAVSRKYTVLVNVMRQASEEISSCLSNDDWRFDGWRLQNFGDNRSGDIDEICKTPQDDDVFCNGRWSKTGSESLWLYSRYSNNWYYLGLQLSVGNQ
jgi:hypothetical protein